MNNLSIPKGQLNINLAGFPIIFSVGFLVTVMLSFIITVSTNETKRTFPFISELGNRIPERNIFTIGVLFSSFFFFIFCACIYYQQKHQIQLTMSLVQGNKFIRTIKFSFIFGVLSSIFLGLAGAFPIGHSYKAHTTFAVLFYIFYCFHSLITDVIYAIVARFSKKLDIQDPKSSMKLAVFHFVIFATIFILTIIFVILAALQSEHSSSASVVEFLIFLLIILNSFLFYIPLKKYKMRFIGF
ncbi:hypothetical protein M0811_11880 [Anaeramoeba ignava]|uniref:CWH43-like N-terminal domain-containing protein n=1 Tax=Anaeramoeba ignava TaxID=1746090 RepID=A0A9Q0LB38_ANAIG|nr:hypothetical protein M0811_11880 [Anaeramoeba ignava]